MALHNVDSLIIETATVAESLPAPGTVPFRTHDLTNTGSAAAVWTAGAGTPFVVDGVAAASVTVPAGRARRVYSDGVSWIVAPTATRRVFAGTGVTDGGGNVTFAFTPPFAAPPVVVGQAGPSGDNALVELKLTALTAASATFNLRRAPSVTILGISVVTFPVNAPGVTVQCTAVQPGQGV